MLSRNAPLLYVQGQGGWRSASVLLRVYARWMPQAFAEGASGQPVRNPRATEAPLTRPLSEPEMRANYLITQNPCASTPSGTLNLLRKFSTATAAVSSTSWASVK